MAEGKRRRIAGLTLGATLLLLVAGVAATRNGVPAKVRSGISKGSDKVRSRIGKESDR